MWLAHVRQQLNCLHLTTWRRTATDNYTVKNLGVNLDNTLTMDDNAKQCVRTCFFHIRRIRVNFAGSLMTTPCILWFERRYCLGWTITVYMPAVYNIHSTSTAESARYSCCVVTIACSCTLVLSMQQLHWLPVASCIFNTNYVCWCLISTTMLHHAGTLQALRWQATSFTQGRACPSQTSLTVAGPEAWNAVQRPAIKITQSSLQKHILSISQN